MHRVYLWIQNIVIEVEINVYFPPSIPKNINNFTWSFLEYFNNLEAGRVELFRAICKDDGDGPGTLRTLGKLMNGSHQSLKELYECSHPQLDTLVHLAQNYSHGARLTGAG